MNQIVHKIWNMWDEHAATRGLRRLPGENNKSLSTRIQNIGKYMENSGRQGLINALSSGLGYDQYNVLTRRIYILTHTPYRTSTFNVTVEDVVHTRITVDDYTTASAGYIVWTDHDGNYTRLLEFIDPPSYTRDNSRKHNGQKIEVTYQYRDGDRIRKYTDKCNPYDVNDESWMGWAPEDEGSILIRSLADSNWLSSSIWKNTDGTPTEKLKSVWREVDAAMPSTWGP